MTDYSKYLDSDLDRTENKISQDTQKSVQSVVTTLEKMERRSYQKRREEQWEKKREQNTKTLRGAKDNKERPKPQKKHEQKEPDSHESEGEEFDSPMERDTAIATELLGQDADQDLIRDVLSESPEVENLKALYSEEEAEKYIDLVVSDAARAEFFEAHPELVADVNQTQSKQAEL